jgi:hypothetical protein
MLLPRSAQRICHPRREFFGKNAFVFVNKAGEKQVVRYLIIPVAGNQDLSDADAKATSPNFLVDEPQTRLAQGPAKFRLVVQLPDAGDPTDRHSAASPRISSSRAVSLSRVQSQRGRLPPLNACHCMRRPPHVHYDSASSEENRQ